jgi:aminocarboxymuconate-semialdehyde decarboxylase
MLPAPARGCYLYLLVIDTQTHCLPPGARRLLQQATGPHHPQAAVLAADEHAYFDLAHRVPLMDALGVDVAAVSLMPFPPLEETSATAELARVANDELLEACAVHPGRFVTLAHLPLPDVGAALAELDRIAGEPLLRGLSIVARQTSYRPDGIGMEPLLARAAELGLPVVLHPTVLSLDFGPGFAGLGLESGMQAMVSTSLVAARIALSGILDRVPDLELVLTNLGGVLPFLGERLDTRRQGPAQRPMTEYLRTRMSFDACGYPAGVAFRCALDAVGPQRILLGSDYPARPVEPHLDAVRSLGLDSAAQAAILGGNAARWFDPARPRTQPALH